MANYKIVGRGVETDPEALRLLAEHDREDELADQIPVNILLNRDQVSVVKHAAHLLGLPPEDYLTQLVVSQAIDDVKVAERALAKPREN